MYGAEYGHIYVQGYELMHSYTRPDRCAPSNTQSNELSYVFQLSF